MSGTKNIFVITTLKYAAAGEKRTVGWFPTLQQATKAVLENVMDIHENSQWYCVIEEIPFGVYCCPPKEEWWYKWNKKEQGYLACKKPDHLKRVVNFGIG